VAPQYICSAAVSSAFSSRLLDCAEIGRLEKIFSVDDGMRVVINSGGGHVICQMAKTSVSLTPTYAQVIIATSGETVRLTLCVAAPP
jgi:hypothetical protein